MEIQCASGAGNAFTLNVEQNDFPPPATLVVNANQWQSWYVLWAGPSPVKQYLSVTGASGDTFSIGAVWHNY